MSKAKIIAGALAAYIVAIAAPMVAPASAQNQASTLSALSPGEWSIRSRGGQELRKICVKNGRELIKLRHSRSRCTTRVLRDNGKSTTVRYTCPGNGYGETTITRETGRLAQIRSQGIEGGSPFDFAAEARRIGSC